MFLFFFLFFFFLTEMCLPGNHSFGTLTAQLALEQLKDGAKLEMRSVPDFDDIYAYIFERTSKDCQEYSDATKAMKDAKKEAAE